MAVQKKFTKKRHRGRYNLSKSCYNQKTIPKVNKRSQSPQYTGQRTSKKESKISITFDVSTYFFIKFFIPSNFTFFHE